MALFDFLKGRRGGTAVNLPRTTLTSVNIRLGGDVHSLPGRDVGEVFNLDIPFRNRMGSGLLPENLKGPDMTVSSITVDRPFMLLGVSPSLPLNVQHMSEAKFTLSIKAPGGSYTGPLLIRFDTGSDDNIDVKISRMMLASGARRVELEGSTSSMNVKKGQAFRRDIQLYKVLSFQQKVNAIEVSKPFELVSSDPSPPFTIDKKDSYITKLYIKCPDFGYAGEVEIRFR